MDMAMLGMDDIMSTRDSIIFLYWFTHLDSPYITFIASHWGRGHLIFPATSPLSLGVMRSLLHRQQHALPLGLTGPSVPLERPFITLTRPSALSMCAGPIMQELTCVI